MKFFKQDACSFVCNGKQYNAVKGVIDVPAELEDIIRQHGFLPHTIPDAVKKLTPEEIKAQEKEAEAQAKAEAKAKAKAEKDK